MYKIMSSWYGQISSANTFEKACTLADGYQIKARSDQYSKEEIFVWFNGEKVYTA